MTTPVSDVVALAVWQAVLNRIDAGGGAQLSFYADAYTGFGQQPNPSALIGVVTLPSPSGSAAAAGIMLNAASAQAQAAGIPRWARLDNALGEFITDGACAADGAFPIALEDGDLMYPGGNILFLGGTVSFG